LQGERDLKKSSLPFSTGRSERNAVPEAEFCLYKFDALRRTTAKRTVNAVGMRGAGMTAVIASPGRAVHTILRIKVRAGY
jgi:hypothetical protein